MRLSEPARRVGPDRVQMAEEFINFCDGLEQAGMREVARKGRCVARELIRAEHEMQDERRLRVTIQRTAERWEAAFRALGTRLERMKGDQAAA